MVVAFGDVQMAGRVELNFMRHVQRCRRRRPAIPAVGLPAVACDRPGLTRNRIEATDPLIIQIAEVQRPIGPDHQAVRVVDFAVRVARRTRTDEGRDRRTGGGRIRYPTAATATEGSDTGSDPTQRAEWDQSGLESLAPVHHT